LGVSWYLDGDFCIEVGVNGVYELAQEEEKNIMCDITFTFLAFSAFDNLV
jgi:hypothetical protein